MFGCQYQIYLNLNGSTDEPYVTTNDSTGEVAEYAKMLASVKEYGGFYIARYEAGTDVVRSSSGSGNTTLIPSKRNKYAYNWVAWSSYSGISLDAGSYGKGAVYLARSVYPESSDLGVVSTLIYGAEWDAAVRFFSDVINPTVSPAELYINNSKDMGWYAYGVTGNSDHKTGIDVNKGTSTALNKVKNIYDMAGNMCEWTMESINPNGRIIRGGSYGVAGWQYPVSIRTLSVDAEYLHWDTCFRIALYLK